MPTQHKNITEADLHETKGASTATAGQVLKASGSGTGTWGKITQLENIDFSDKTKNAFGWNSVQGSVYTSGSPLSLTAGVKTKVTINGLGALTDQSRLGNIWDTTNNELTIDDANASYSVRFVFKAKAAAGAASPYAVHVTGENTGPGSVNPIMGHTQFILGGSAVNYCESLSILFMGTINAYPTTFYLTATTATDVYDFRLVIQKLYKES